MPSYPVAITVNMTSAGGDRGRGKREGGKEGRESEETDKRRKRREG